MNELFEQVKKKTLPRVDFFLCREYLFNKNVCHAKVSSSMFVYIFAVSIHTTDIYVCDVNPYRV